MEDQRQAESIEAGKRRKAGSLQQTVEVLQIKELQEQRDSRGQFRAERVAFFVYGDDGRLLLASARPNLSQEERALMGTIKYDVRPVRKN